jgi:hypothetical protein
MQDKADVLDQKARAASDTAGVWTAPTEWLRLYDRSAPTTGA